MGESGELLQGTLEMLVLKALSLQPMHGWGIGHRIEQLARGLRLVQTHRSNHPIRFGDCAPQSLAAAQTVLPQLRAGIPNKS